MNKPAALQLNIVASPFKHSVQSLAKRLKVEDLLQNAVENVIVSVGITTISVSSVVTIFIAATEALAEVVVVVVLAYIVAAIAIVCVPIDKRASVVGMPAISMVSPSGSKAFLITVSHGLLQQPDPVLIRFVIGAATMVTIVRGSVEVRIMVIIVVTLVPDTYLLLTQSL